MISFPFQKSRKSKLRKYQNKMVIAHPVSNSDNRSNETLIADHDGNVINSNSLESVPSLLSDVRKLHMLPFIVESVCNLFIFVFFTTDKWSSATVCCQHSYDGTEYANTGGAPVEIGIIQSEYYEHQGTFNC